MPRMIELMKQSAVPANVMRSAAKGALALPPAEMIEILVYLTSSPIFGEEAGMTLAGWDEAACLAVCSDPTSPREVLDYFAAPQNRRPRLVPALLENTSVLEPVLLDMAQEQSREVVQWLLASARVTTSLNVLDALVTNPLLTPAEVEEINSALAALGGRAPEPEGVELDEQVLQFITDHAAEIAAEEGKPFQLIGGADELVPAQPTPAAAAPAAPVAAAAAQAKRQEGMGTRTSPWQRISILDVAQRVQLAMKGDREERIILVRDGARIVSSAVLESPKLTEQEVELFASLTNVTENVLRGIAGKRKFMKTYGVVRALVNNPRCPLDLQLTLVKNLLNQDLKGLSVNKNISDTLRKVALKLLRERTEKKKAFE